MTAEKTRTYDPALLASRIRKFATLAHRAVKDPAFRDRRAPELSRHLAFLEDQIEDLPRSPLARWIENARRLLGPM
jgi:hypothetical protein